ncbi:amino acid permease/ SLC12A domain-containing protein [Polychytrium aggregatum]|uniref:amino acid permease/ SLC12A domain-containing protein n=1 Tax=Polychytrium aggregatum TaxID=110093 RepID=UPI0022FDD72A|nr:amino acid permease/ SLC12A domain-containing protein [Polychytrium aggregatum]KAI9208072.1 amino acid permease/ SLC12A domain-containing protein [Polychytrium aggregatum]
MSKTEEHYTVESEGEMQHGLKRGLEARHLQMISLGGTIGTGLFLTTGTSIASCGPTGALIAYIVVGFLVFCMMTCLGEMTTYLPVSGGFNHYAGRFVDPALGFALGWNYWFSWVVTIAIELSAAGIIIAYWNPNIYVLVMPLTFYVIIFLFNCVGVKFYGEMEYWFAIIKILTCLVFIIVSILVNVGAVGGGRQYIGFKYWTDPGMFTGNTVSFLSLLATAAFSFQGTELVAIAAGEAANPRRNIPKAINNVFWRILFFYVTVILMIGLDIPYTDPDLSQGSSSTDPTYASFTLVFRKAGWGVATDIVNGVILTAVLSACNSDMYSSSRILCALAREGKAPSIFGRVTRQGVPFYALCLSNFIALICLLSAVFDAAGSFVWLINLTTVVGLISWAGIGLTAFRFRRAYVAQDRRISDLPYKSLLFPFAPLFVFVGSTVIIILQGLYAFTPVNALSIVGAYCGIIPFLLAYVIYKITTRSRVIPLTMVDLDTGRVDHYEGEDQAKANDAKRGILGKIIDLVA